MEKKIMVNDFVSQYKIMKNEELRKNYVRKIVKRNYVPVLEKKIILDIMLQKSITADENGIQYIDMFLHKLNVISAIIVLYTNIEVEKNKQGQTNTTEMYDLLVSNNILDVIYEEIGDDELNELMSINKLLLDTWHNQNSSTESYLYKLFNSVSKNIGATIGIGMSKLSEVLSDNEKTTNIINQIEKIVNKQI